MPTALERLTTERVPQKRALPIAAGIVVIGIIGVLVAKPWGSDTAPGALASPIAAASPAASSNPVRTPGTVRLLPTPDIGPLGPIDNLTVEFVSDGPQASCAYSRPRRGVQHLEAIEVQPPTILVDYSEAEVGNITTLSWTFELEMNRRETLFERSWETVARAGKQKTAAVEDQPTSFAPLSLDYNAGDDAETAVSVLG